MEFLSTPSARRATSFRRSCIRRKVISIHALREEGDTCRDQYDELQRLFLSTPSARRATGRCVQLLNQRIISIHALREEGDRVGRLYFAAVGIFLSTPSARRATSGLFTLMFGAGFLSTPSARRATKPAKSGGKRPGNFYPRPPRGGRPLNRRTIMQQVNFYPRPPRGGRLTVHGPEDLVDAISIHALREEGDRRGPLSGREKCRFLSTPSARRATWSASGAAARPRFLSTPSARRATFPVLPAWCPGQISIHALREEGDRSSVTREMMV